MAADESGHSLEQQIACCVRELAFRERVYPRWVKDGKIKQPAADYQMACMRSVIRTLERLQQAPKAAAKLEGGKDG